jgi:hypothetical protein
VAWTLQAAAPDECRAILEKALKAHGGKEKLEKLKAMQTKGKGTLELGGNSVPFTQEGATQLPDKLKQVMELSVNGVNIKVTTVYDGKQGWISNNGMTMDMNQTLLDLMKEATYHITLGRFGFLDDKSYKLTPLGEIKVNDRPAVGVKVSHEGHKDVSLYFDKEKGWLVKSEARTIEPMSGQEIAEERIVSDYQEVDGVQVPKKAVINRDGKKFMDLEVTEVKLLEKLDDSEFAKP